MVLAYEAYDACALADLVARKEVCAEELLEEAIRRTQTRNPQLNAVVLHHYEEARAQIAAGLPQGPFTGVPFLLKNIGGLELKNTPTTSSCALFTEILAAEDSPLTRGYKQAGLVIFGKTNTPEFGLSTSTEPRLYGITHNPWGPDLSPGGSSGGAGAAVAAGLVPMAQASDGGGSIRIPAAACGLFGFKPSRGLMPDSKEQWGGLGTVHALTVSVRDSATLLGATSSLKGDVSTPPPPLRIAFNARRFDGSVPDPAISQALQKTARLCEDLGHRVEEALPCVDTEAFGRHQITLICTSLPVSLEAVRGQEEFLEPITRVLAGFYKPPHPGGCCEVTSLLRADPKGYGAVS